MRLSQLLLECLQRVVSCETQYNLQLWLWRGSSYQMSSTESESQFWRGGRCDNSNNVSLINFAQTLESVQRGVPFVMCILNLTCSRLLAQHFLGLLDHGCEPQPWRWQTSWRSWSGGGPPWTRCPGRCLSRWPTTTSRGSARRRLQADKSQEGPERAHTTPLRLHDVLKRGAGDINILF